MKLPLGSVLAFLIGFVSLQAQITPSLGAWEKTYGVDKYQHPMRIIVAEYDRLIAVSYNKVEDSDTLDLWLTKIDDEGKQMWERSIGQLESDMINQFFYVPDESQDCRNVFGQDGRGRRNALEEELRSRHYQSL